jgi:hypothetical protein
LAALVNFEHDGGEGGYEASADAMWKAALMAFNYVASQVGASGFQASWAALKFYGEAMGIKGPFGVYKLEDALYPQYDLVGRLSTFIDDQREWLRDEAKKRLDEHPDGPTFVADRVWAHWQKLAAS